MTRLARALVQGGLVGAVVGAAATALLGGEPTAKLIVAAMPIPEGAPITVSMLEAREVPARFMSKRKLGVVQVAGVLGQEAPQAMRAGDFIDPTHFGSRPDVCALDARSLAAQLGLQGGDTAGFIERLSGEPLREAPGPKPTR
ncbi:MAG: hypothetical protein SFW67_10735 [Myxococcaceae bacterium]|nr:hypothetical protein [Myxococcaceae bacterium]